MRGGQYLNNWRMAELHAKESPDRVRNWKRGAHCSTVLTMEKYFNAILVDTNIRDSHTSAIAQVSK